MTTTPPGRAGIDGPITGRIRAIMPARLGAFRLGVTRLGFVPTDTQDAVNLSASGNFYENWRDDPEPDEYGPPYAGTKVVE